MKVFNKTDTVRERIGDYNFEIARENNHAYRNKFKQIQKRYKRQMENDNISAEQDDELLAEAMAGTILVGWEQVASSGDKEVKFSVAEAKDTLLDYDFRSEISRVAGDLNRFLEQEESTLVKK